MAQRLVWLLCLTEKRGAYQQTTNIALRSKEWGFQSFPF